jgi:hypothetical protein
VISPATRRRKFPTRSVSCSGVPSPFGACIPSAQLVRAQRIEPDGTAEIFVTGFTNERDPFHRPLGTEYRAKVASHFEGSQGAGIRADRQNCNFDFAKLTLPAAKLKQVDAPAFSVKSAMLTSAAARPGGPLQRSRSY